MSTSEAIEKVTNYFPEITQEDSARQLKSGGNQWKNAVRWAKQNLIHAGEVDGSIWAVWKITDKGKLRLEREWTSWKPEYREKSPSGEKVSRSLVTPKEGDEFFPSRNPPELLETALNAINESLQNDILGKLSSLDPSSFESIISDLLGKMNYGNPEVLGRSGDGGIDGTCSVDALGLFKLHFQAKRWKNQVGAKEIRDFIGGMQTSRGEYGIFVTTSDFSQDAIETAKKSGRVRLVNGREFARLMIEYELGVTRKQLHLPKIDQDYFESL